MNLIEQAAKRLEELERAGVNPPHATDPTLARQSEAANPLDPSTARARREPELRNLQPPQERRADEELSHVEVDAIAWKVKRRIAAGDGVYNLAVTRRGRLIATNKRDQSVSVFDLGSGKELARLKTKRKVLHGVVVSPDDRYAFVSVEGIGSQPGTVEIIDLDALKIVASVDVPSEAAGIDFLRMEP